jgi:hypothetical protein
MVNGAASQSGKEMPLTHLMRRGTFETIEDSYFGWSIVIPCAPGCFSAFAFFVSNV